MSKWLSKNYVRKWVAQQIHILGCLWYYSKASVFENANNPLRIGQWKIRGNIRLTTHLAKNFVGWNNDELNIYCGDWFIYNVCTWLKTFILLFANNKLMSLYSVLLPKMVRFHQVVTWLHIPTFHPPHNILYPMLQFSGASSRLTPALSLSFSFGCHLWHLQSQNRLTYLLYQCSKKWLHFIISSSLFTVIWCDCCCMLVHTMSSCTLGWWDFLGADFRIFCTTSLLQRFRYACGLIKISVMRLWF